MEKGFEDIKKLYLETQPTITATEGFADVLMRLNKKEEKPLFSFRYRYLAIGIATLLLAVTASLLVFPESKAATAVKAASQKAINLFANPTVTPTPTQKIEMMKLKKQPTVTPSITPIKPTGKPTIAPGKTISEQKRLSNPTTSDEKVKGASTTRKPTTVPVVPQVTDEKTRGNSEEHRNENAQSTNQTTNPSSEKSNGKSKKLKTLLGVYFAFFTLRHHH